MKRLSAALGFSLFFAACGDAMMAPAPTPDPQPMTMPTPATGRFVGSIVDLGQKPLANIPVQLCGATCFGVATDDSGVFSLSEVPAGSYTVRVSPIATQIAEFGKVVLPIYGYEPTTMPVRALAPVVLPRVGAATSLGGGPQRVDIDATLALTLDLGQLELPADNATPNIAGVRVPAALYPDFCLPSGDGRVLAEWALTPFGATSNVTIDVHIGENLGLPPGTRVNLMIIDPDTGRPQGSGIGEVALDGKSIDSEATLGLRRLTWLIVTQYGGGA